MYLNVIKAIYNKPITNIILNRELKSLLLESRIIQGHPPSFTYSI
jgi:hypothetical protein